MRRETALDSDRHVVEEEEDVQQSDRNLSAQRAGLRRQRRIQRWHRVRRVAQLVKSHLLALTDPRCEVDLVSLAHRVLPREEEIRRKETDRLSLVSLQAASQSSRTHLQSSDARLARPVPAFECTLRRAKEELRQLVEVVNRDAHEGGLDRSVERVDREAKHLEEHGEEEGVDHETAFWTVEERDEGVHLSLEGLAMEDLGLSVSVPGNRSHVETYDASSTARC